MTFEQLLYVEVLSHYNSLQEAANVLHISKPGLSLAISQLEEELGVKIFDRTSKGTILTNDGVKLISSISDILKSKANLERLVSSSKDINKKETIRIRYINTMFNSFIDSYITNYEEKYKNVFYDISRDDTKSIIEQVRNGRINAGFISTSDIESEWIKDLSFKPVCHGKIVLGVSKNSHLLNKTITFDDLKNLKFCIFDDIYHETLFERLQYICGPLNLILKTDDYWAITEAVTKLDAVCIGRSQQSILSREKVSETVLSIDIGHLINDISTLGWLTNPGIKQSKLLSELMNTINKDIVKRLNNTVV